MRQNMLFKNLIITVNRVQHNLQLLCLLVVYLCDRLLCIIGFLPGILASNLIVFVKLKVWQCVAQSRFKSL